MAEREEGTTEGIRLPHIHKGVLGYDCTKRQGDLFAANLLVLIIRRDRRGTEPRNAASSISSRQADNRAQPTSLP